MNWTKIAVAALMAAALATPVVAGEAFVTKARGTSITIDKGADDGIEVGLDMTIVRPPEEAVIHPLTGENLGAPEIELVTGKVSKVSARAASITLISAPLLSLRPGDVARFVTIEEQMVLDQEMSTETAEKAASEREQIRSDAGRLAKNISSIQGTIRGLERAIRELRRYDDDVVKPQFNSINRQIAEMRDKLTELRTTVSLLNSVPIGMEGEEGEVATMTEEQIAELNRRIADLEENATSLVPPPAGTTDMPPPVEDGMDPMAEEEVSPFFLQPWFIIVVGALGILGIAFFAYMKMAGGDDEDNEDNEDNEDEQVVEEFEDEDEDEDDEIEVDVEEEEDDIVVEETS